MAYLIFDGAFLYTVYHKMCTQFLFFIYFFYGEGGGGGHGYMMRYNEILTDSWDISIMVKPVI